MKRKLLVILTIVLSLSIFFYACEKDETDPIEQEDDNEEELSLTEILEKEYHALGNDPMSWSDEELSFLDEYANKKIVGLGEATHGTKEFFEAKHRIFQYLVENHGFKIFVIEADFGESLFINEMVQSGDVNVVEEYMQEYMHFWTWKTQEVKALIEWMCEYNLGKSDEEKVHYMGNDCRFNTYHPTMAKEYLVHTNASFQIYANEILDLAQSAYDNNFSSFPSFRFENEFMPQLLALEDTIRIYKTELIEASSEKEYELFVRIVKLVKQVSELTYNKESYWGPHIRDSYMAENTAWMHEYFDGKKIAVWAHNAHVSNAYQFGNMGGYLDNQFQDDYGIIGFQFSKGSFNAGIYNETSLDSVVAYTIDSVEVANSLGAHFTKAAASNFTIEIANLQSYPEWDDVLNNYVRYISIGAIYNENQSNYYNYFLPNLFDHIIYIDSTSSSVILN